MIFAGINSESKHSFGMGVRDPRTEDGKKTTTDNKLLAS